MTDSNRTRFCTVLETSLGVTPNTPRMKTMTLTGESLKYKPEFVESDAIRSDRMTSDPIKIGESNDGAINYEFAFPVDETSGSDVLVSLMMSAWANTPYRDNDGTADSRITNVANSTDVVTVAAGSAFVSGHLVRFSGFADAGNNGVFRCTTGSATVPAFLGAGFVADATPAAAARIKVVGFQGASGDLAAVSNGITSTTLDFTTLGLNVGSWIKIGGTGSSFRFTTAADNGWARVTAIAAHKITLDNLPTGWSADTGTGKTLRVFFGDQIKNGVDIVGLTLERGFLAQETPSYIIQRGMVAGQGEFNFASKQKVTSSITFAGMTGELTTTPLDAVPDAAPKAPIMSANVNVGRIAENGVVVTAPNYVKSAKITINNNTRTKDGIGFVGAVDIGSGSCTVGVSLETYFGDDALFSRVMAGDVTNLNLLVNKEQKAVVFALPRLTFTDGSPSAGGKNQDVMLPLTTMASYDELTNAHVLIDRLEYYEA